MGMEFGLEWLGRLSMAFLLLSKEAPLSLKTLTRVLEHMKPDYLTLFSTSRHHENGATGPDGS